MAPIIYKEEWGNFSSKFEGQPWAQLCWWVSFHWPHCLTDHKCGCYGEKHYVGGGVQPYED